MPEQYHIHWTDKRSCTHKRRDFINGQNYVLNQTEHDLLKPIYSFEYVETPEESAVLGVSEVVVDLRNKDGYEQFNKDMGELLESRTELIRLRVLYPEESQPVEDIVDDEEVEGTALVDDDPDTPPTGDVAGWSADDVLYHGDYKARMKWLTHREIKLSEFEDRSDAALIAYIEANFTGE